MEQSESLSESAKHYFVSGNSSRHPCAVNVDAAGRSAAGATKQLFLDDVLIEIIAFTLEHCLDDGDSGAGRSIDLHLVMALNDIGVVKVIRRDTCQVYEDHAT